MNKASSFIFYTGISVIMVCLLITFGHIGGVTGVIVGLGTTICYIIGKNTKR